MTLQWANIFLTVLECGSFSAAARRLHMTQPAVSMAVSAMEQQVNQKLIDRSPGQRSALIPTRAGLIFKNYCHQFIQMYSEMKIKMLQDHYFEPFSVASSPTPGSIVLPVLAGSFSESFPHAKLSLYAYHGRELPNFLRKREIDIAISGIIFDDNDLITEPFFNDPMVLICPHSMKFDNNTITLRHLQKLPLIVRNNNCNTMKIISKALEQSGYPLSSMNITMQVFSNMDVLQAVSAGSGVGFVTSSLICSSPSNSESIRVITVKRLNIGRNLNLIRLKNREYSDSIELFWNYATGSYWRENKFSYNTIPSTSNVSSSLI